MKIIHNPTLLEIATNFALWQEYADPSGIDSEEQFNERSESENLQILQACGFREIMIGDLYTDDGFIAKKNVEVEIRACVAGGKPTIRIETHVILTEDCEISADEITGPGGWYVVVRATEGGEE